MSSVPQRRLPELTNAGLAATAEVTAHNEYGEPVDGAIAIERALTIYLDKREVVTLMTLGNYPELLILGWLRNQRMVEDISAITGAVKTCFVVAVTEASSGCFELIVADIEGLIFMLTPEFTV